MQMGIILAVSFLGELLNKVIPLPFPASIYGLIIMFLLLVFKVIKVEDVKETANFLIEIMILMFIAPAVGLMESFDKLVGILMPLTVITFLSTVIVMVVSGRVTQFFVRKKGNK